MRLIVVNNRKPCKSFLSRTSKANTYGIVGHRDEGSDAVGPLSRGLLPPPRSDPIGRLVPGEQVTDATDVAIFAAPHGKPFQREGRTGAIPQEMFESPKVARHIAIDERDPDAGDTQKRSSTNLFRGFPFGVQFIQFESNTHNVR
jgi:hypothetical protein